jgi:hypothetical protein
MSKQQKRGKGSPKTARFGNKQAHGQSRARYAALRSARIAANKARRIKKELDKQQAASRIKVVDG